MGWFEAIVLGLVQGLTEFLPVSSSGHLVLMQKLLGLSRIGLFFEIALHAATLGAVVLFYRKRITELIVGVLKREPAAWRYGAKLAIATLPAVVAVLLAGDFFEYLYDVPTTVALALFATGLMLFTTRRTVLEAVGEEPSFVAAFWIGTAQAFAIVPGISRSGATVAVALALGVAPRQAAEFSFLMSVVAILGATVHSLPELSGASSELLGLISLGAIVAFLSGLAGLWLFIRILKTQHLHRFAYYLWTAGALFLTWMWLQP